MSDESPKKIAKIRIDRDICIGAASCLAVMARTFELDSENKAVVVSKDGSKTSEMTSVDGLVENGQEELLLAAQSCPTQAILLYDEDGKQIYP